MDENSINNIFKAYDIRGVYPLEINEDVAYKIGQAIVRVIKTKKIVVGRDNRPSSPKIYESLVNGITSMGCDVVDVGLTTTPLLFFSLGRLNADFGVMITASHNPKKYNGFKLAKKEAVPLNLKDMKKIKKLVINKKLKTSSKKGKIYKMNFSEEYLKKIYSYYTSKKKISVVVDTGNGMGGLVVPKLLSKISADVKYINLKIDDKKTHEANPLKIETLKQLQEEVISRKADVGVAFDEDCDRVGFVDETGTIIQMDLITSFLSKIILKQKPNSKIIYDLRSSNIVKETILNNKGIPIECRVGHTFIKKKMRTINCDFAGEVSGHYYFSDFFYVECPLLVLILIINSLEKQKLSSLIKPFKKYYKSQEINFKVENTKKIIKILRKEYFKGKIKTNDGLKITFNNWWFNIRPSNTESLLRLNLEANTKELLEEKIKELTKIIKSK